VGTLAGYINDYTRIENLVISSDIMVISDSPSSGWEEHMLGGIAGYSSSYNTFEGITANVVLYQEGKYSIYQGGVLGYQGGSFTNFNNIDMTINGSVKGKNNQNSYVGGIVGYSEASGTTFSNLRSSGKLTTLAGSGYMGGLIGELRRGKLTNSSSSVNLDNMNAYAGRLVGQARTSIIENSLYSGTIKNNHNTGGAVGYLIELSILNNVTFTGVIISESSYIGGIAGYADQLQATNLVSEGIVSGNYQVGGLFGVVNNSQVTRSFSNSIVTVLNSGAGAISGASYSTIYSQIIADGVVSGTSTSTDRYNISGFIGYGSNNTIENAIVLAEIKDNGTATGGFFGDDQGTNKILNSYANVSIQNMFGNVGLISGSTNTNLVIENTFAISSTDVGLYGNRSSLEGAVNVYSTFKDRKSVV
jgi:hypothetical protein